MQFGGMHRDDLPFPAAFESQFGTLAQSSPGAAHHTDCSYTQRARLADSPMPPNLNWAFWLGPAPERPFNPIYHPTGWRGWWDFGGGALADMGPHLLDPIFTGLKLGGTCTISVEASADGNNDVLP